MLRLTELTAEEMTDDQRDAFVTMAGNLGIDSEDAEDLIDGFLEETRAREITSIVGRRPAPAAPRAHGGGEPAGGPAALPPALTEAEERARYPTFVTALGQEMLLIPSGQFNMGSTRPGAAPNEAPVMKVHLRRFHIARYPVTNAQYERFDPAHRSRRLATATECHPVVHVSHHDAVRFCTWLSSMERRRCRLPTEAEWEYAAKGASESTYPWGEHVGTGRLANFADARTRFPWSDLGIDDGYDETAPVGSYPLGASPFGVEDMAGNVWEWCHDHFDAYKGGGERLNPTGPSQGSLKVVRGGSWRSRFSSLRTTSRAGHPPAFACNDIGFRVVIECD